MNNQAQIQNLLDKLRPETIADKVVPGLIKIVIIMILALIALRMAKLISNRMIRVFQRKTEDMEFQKRAHTLSSVVRNVMKLTIVSVAVIMILGELRINIAPVLATAGIVGLAVGFGAQNLVQDVIMGFFILLDDQIRVGDVVEIAGKSGLVEKVDLRMTTLRDLSGNVHYVRHGKVDVVTNMTKDFSHFVFDIPVGYGENVDAILAILKDVDEELRNDPIFGDDILAPIEVMGLDRFAEAALMVKARTKTRPMKQWSVAREFNRRLKKAFDDKKIEMPHRQVTLSIGRDRESREEKIRPAAGENAEWTGGTE